MTKMREILFRGFHPCEDGDKTVYVEGKAVKGRWEYGGYWLNETVIRQTPYILDCYGDSIKVLSSTVSQYTGLTDKNGVKIFEGDVLRCDFYSILPQYSRYTVTYSNEHAEFIGEGHIKQNLESLAKTKYCAIIGNIHEQKDGESNG